MLRVYYLFPLLVFMIVLGALYRENKTVKAMKKIQNREIRTGQSVLSLRKTNNNFK